MYGSRGFQIQVPRDAKDVFWKPVKASVAVVRDLVISRSVAMLSYQARVEIAPLMAMDS